MRLFGYDKVNPYVELHITKPWEKAKEAAKQKTAFKLLTNTPQWEEEISFLIDKRDGAGQLTLTLCDSLLVGYSLSSPCVIDLDKITLDQPFAEREASLDVIEYYRFMY